MHETHVPSLCNFVDLYLLLNHNFFSHPCFYLSRTYYEHVSPLLKPHYVLAWLSLRHFCEETSFHSVVSSSLSNINSCFSASTHENQNENAIGPKMQIIFFFFFFFFFPFLNILIDSREFAQNDISQHRLKKTVYYFVSERREVDENHRKRGSSKKKVI